MTYKGTVKGGVVVLEQGSTLSDGTVVRVEPISPAEGVQELRKALLEIAGTVEGLPHDLADNHDHSIHGTPRK